MSGTTPIRSIDRDDPDPAVLDEAAAILRAGGLAAFATETVYGLGAVATDPIAVARIFAAKGRPAFNPLIVHADAPAMARRHVAAWPPEAQTLADRFWPGPLTLVLPRAASIPDAVTGGLATVGVRVPAPPVARRLIRRVGLPLAAPSANRSTGISPTLARHVLADLDGRIDLILDSGPTTVGLESTVIDLSGAGPRILRPGPITAAMLSEALGGAAVSDPAGTADADRPTSPGQLAIHYAPRTPAYRIESPGALRDVGWPARSGLLVLGEHRLPPIPGHVERLDLIEPDAAARGLYAALHRFDEAGFPSFLVVMPPDLPAWRAIRDRLRRATRPLPDG